MLFRSPKARRDPCGLALALQRKNPVDDARTELARDLSGAVDAAVGDHHDLVAEGQTAQAVRQARFIVLRAHQSR